MAQLFLFHSTKRAVYVMTSDAETVLWVETQIFSECENVTAVDTAAAASGCCGEI